MIFLLVGGAAVISYPTVSDWWNSYHQSRAIAVYASAVNETNAETLKSMMEDARAYNATLPGKPHRYSLSAPEKAEYQSLLNITDDGIMGYIQVVRLRINYPIYHGVEEEQLQKAIGHIEGTSLPVGGETTHAVVSGHRGLPRARLFSDLDEMVEGDTFTITILRETFTYEVDQIRIVEPNDLSDLNIDEGKDFVTLLTCTPYGVNTHRLLVRGHRIPNISGTAAIPPEALKIPNYIAIPAVGLPLLFIYLAGELVFYRLMPESYNKELVMKELDRLKDVNDG